jgi:hypothetical protein
MPVSERFRAVLEARREALNQRFAQRGRALDPAAFSAYLQRTADPLVDSAGDGAADAAALALFELGLVALERGLIGASAASPFERVLVGALPRFGAHWRGAPAIVSRAVSNGYDQLRRALDEASAAGWLDAWATLASTCANREELLDAGLALAWKAGLAEARSRALARATARGRDFRMRTLGVPEIDTRPELRFVRPGEASTPLAIAVVARVGGFTGFGGPFRVPPRVGVIDERLVATDGASFVELFADAFGARLVPAPWARGAAELAAVSNPLTPTRPELCHLDAIAGSRYGSLLTSFRDVTSVAATAGMAALTTADSHQLAVIGFRGGAAT